MWPFRKKEKAQKAPEEKKIPTLKYRDGTFTVSQRTYKVVLDNGDEVTIRHTQEVHQYITQSPYTGPIVYPPSVSETLIQDYVQSLMHSQLGFTDINTGIIYYGNPARLEPVMEAQISVTKAIGYLE